MCLHHYGRRDEGVQELSNDEERDAFIEQFWLRVIRIRIRRTTSSRRALSRIAYANEHLRPASRVEDRPRPHYISFASRIRSIRTLGGSYQRPMEEGGGETSTFPFEVWHYRYLEALAKTSTWSLWIPASAATSTSPSIAARRTRCCTFRRGNQYEEMARQEGRPLQGRMKAWHRPDVFAEQSKQFDRIELAAKIFAPRRSSSAIWTTYFRAQADQRPIFPFDVRTDFVKVTTARDGSGDGADQEPRHHVRDQGWGVKGIVNILIK